MNPITVLLSEDHAIVRQGLRLLLETAEDVQVVGEAENGRQSVAEAQRLRPNVVLMDLAMPLLNGVEATRQIVKAVPSIRVLILSSYSDGHHVREAIQAGAAGYLIKEAAGSDLLSAVHEVHMGHGFFSPLISKGLLIHWRGRDSRSPNTNGAKLTIREMEVLQLIAEGYASKQIADLLAISEKTTGRHRQTLMDKLDLHKIAALTHYAVSSGMIEVNRLPFGAHWRAARRGAPFPKDIPGA
jgi:DNA-binding NarL/FixJ family response regulator